MLLVHADHVELGGRLVEDARPRAAAVARDVGAAVVALDRVVCGLSGLNQMP